MELKRVNLDNLEQEHICCAISEKKGKLLSPQKKQWLRQRMKEGLVFLKLDERGKVFIEYLPAEAAWAPVEAPGYLYIDCFWVSGKYKGKGYGDALLEECIADGKAQGKKGLVVLSTKKKMPFLSDPGYLKYKGFIVADTCEPYYELLYLPFEEGAQVPKFCHSVKKAAVPKTAGRCTTPISALTRQNTCLSWSMQRRNGGSKSSRFILKAGKRRRMHRIRLRPMLSIVTENS